LNLNNPGVLREAVCGRRRRGDSQLDWREGREGKKNSNPAKPGMGEIPYLRAVYYTLLVLFFIFFFFSVPASCRDGWEFPCPSSPLPLFYTLCFVGREKKKKSQTKDQMCEGAVRLHCIAKRLTARNVGGFFWTPRNFQGEPASFASLRRPAFPHRTVTVSYPNAPFWTMLPFGVGIVQKYYLFGPGRHTPSKHRGTGGAPGCIGTSSVPPPSPPLYTTTATKAVSAIPKSCFPESSSFLPYSYMP
jgi:hypothetical protein